MRTKSSIDYITPNNIEIKEVAKRVNLNTYSPSLVRDISNVVSGGEILTSQEYREELISNIPDVKPDGAGAYSYTDKYGQNKWTQDRKIAVSAISDRVIEINEHVCEFLRTIDYSKLPGDTPLEQACGLLKTLASAGDRVGSDNTAGEELPIFTEHRADNLAEDINSIHEFIETLDDAEKELLEEKDDQDRPVKGGIGHGSGTFETKLAEDMIKGRHHWLEVSRNLETLVRFRLGKSSKTAPDNEGDDISKRSIKGFGELGKIPAIEYALPETYRLFRVATKATQVRERVSRMGKKQLIYMIIDCSYSMRGSAMHKAGGVLLNRLKSVVEGDAEIYFRFFDTELFTEYKAREPNQAKALITKFRKETFNGDGTNIVKCVRKAMSRIEDIMESGELSERPELVVVTDGQDYTKDLKESEFKKNNLRLHTFIVESTNRHLAQLARDTGGVGVDKL